MEKLYNFLTKVNNRRLIMFIPAIIMLIVTILNVIKIAFNIQTVNQDILFGTYMVFMVLLIIANYLINWADNKTMELKFKADDERLAKLMKDKFVKERYNLEWDETQDKYVDKGYENN